MSMLKYRCEIIEVEIFDPGMRGLIGRGSEGTAKITMPPLGAVSSPRCALCPLSNFGWRTVGRDTKRRSFCRSLCVTVFRVTHEVWTKISLFSHNRGNQESRRGD